MFSFPLPLSNLTSPSFLNLDTASIQWADNTISRTLFTVDRSGSTVHTEVQEYNQSREYYLESVLQIPNLLKGYNVYTFK